MLTPAIAGSGPYLHVTWGLHPRLYAYARYRGLRPLFARYLGLAPQALCLRLLSQGKKYLRFRLFVQSSSSSKHMGVYEAVQDLFSQTARQFSSSVAIDNGRRRVTYGELET